MTMQKATKQILYLYVSTLLGTLLGVLSSIINTRFLAPVFYGDVRYVQNIIQFIASLLLFGYFLSGSRLLAISNREREKREIRGCMVIILLMAIVILMVATILCAVAHQGEPQLAHLFLISVPISAYPLLLSYINTTAQGDNHIGRLSMARLFPGLLYIPLAFWIYRVYGATSQRMILLQWGMATLVLLILVVSTRPSFKNLAKSFSRLSTENKTYGFQLYIGSLVMVATNYVAGISLGLFSEDNVYVGFYTLSLTVTTPLAMLPSIIGTTYFKDFAKMDRIPPKILMSTIWMTVGSCILFVLLIKQLIVFLYTDDYAAVGVYASWLAVGFSIHGLGDMLNRYLGSHGRGKEIRDASIANGIFKVFGYIVFVYYWNITGAIVTTIVCDCIYAGMILWYYIRFVKMRQALRL